SFLFQWLCHHRGLHSFPTRRSSDLFVDRVDIPELSAGLCVQRDQPTVDRSGENLAAPDRDAAIDDVAAHDRGAALVDFGIERPRSEEHTSELQSRENLVCRLLLEKK